MNDLVTLKGFWGLVGRFLLVLFFAFFCGLALVVIPEEGPAAIRLLIICVIAAIFLAALLFFCYKRYVRVHWGGELWYWGLTWAVGVLGMIFGAAIAPKLVPEEQLLINQLLRLLQ